MILTDSNNNYSFDLLKLQDAISSYKSSFADSIWPEEEYKWEAIKCFQDNWNINAPDFAEMLEASLKKTLNLLTSARRFAKNMIVEFATMFPEDVRAMFINLYDESRDVYERINQFITMSDELLPKWLAIKGLPDGRMHFQNINAVTIYLWLKFPNKYYIYKYTLIKKVAEKLDSSYMIKQGNNAENIRSFMKLYNEIRQVLQSDPEMKMMLDDHLNEKCYSDPSLNTMTMDLGFYIGQSYMVSSNKQNEVYGADYESGLTVDDWIELLQNKTVFTENALEIVKCFKDYGGEASCAMIAQKYGRTAGFYNIGSTKLAKRIIKYTGCPNPQNSDGTDSFWPVLYTGRNATSDEYGAFIWKLRPQLSEALDSVDLSDIELYGNHSDENDNTTHYWWLDANPNIWSFSNISVGQCEEYSLYNSNGNKRRVFQNFLDAKVGDKVIGYESAPIKQIVALAEVAEEQDGETIMFRKTENLENTIDYQTLKDCDELTNMEFFLNPRGSLFKLTEDEYNFIMDLIRENNRAEKEETLPKYSEEDFLREVFMPKERYERLVSVLKDKKNIILQGAPGVGKTFAAKRLAYSIMGVKDDNRIEFVQFHQNYSYEDFVMGYKPSEAGFELRNGIFYRFCQKAANQPDQDFFFIIDEINRGNMSKIFGELLMLIEKDYRGEKATLAYNGMQFSVPKNLYIIGMMNTADRSLAMIDYALRRRFSFFKMTPGFVTDGFIKYQNEIGNDTFDALIARICELNKEITTDKSLGEGFCIGHSYFCNISDCTEELLKSIVEAEIIPMLEEYWFDDDTKIKRWSNNLNGVFNG